jgi:hypothetical protein
MAFMYAPGSLKSCAKENFELASSAKTKRENNKCFISF